MLTLELKTLKSRLAKGKYPQYNIDEESDSAADDMEEELDEEEDEEESDSAADDMEEELDEEEK